MPACFQLTRKGESEPSTLNAIDEAICKAFNVPCDEKLYHAYWYDVIGFRLALGKSFAEIHEYLAKEEATCPKEYTEHYTHLLAISHWLELNYMPSAWYSRGCE